MPSNLDAFLVIDPSFFCVIYFPLLQISNTGRTNPMSLEAKRVPYCLCGNSRMRKQSEYLSPHCVGR